MKKLLLILLVAFTIQATGFSQINNISSGQYSEMALAYNPETKIVTGYYNNGTGDNGKGLPLFTCLFYMEGKMINGKAFINTYYPQFKLNKEPGEYDIPGVLTYVSSKEIALKLKENPAGCDNVQQFQIKAASLYFDKKENWIAIKYVVAGKAYFYQDDNTTRRKGYILKGDIVYIDSEKDGWAHCTYITDKWKRIAGWIKTTDLNVLK